MGAVATIIGAGWTVLTFADTTYAKRPDVILVAERLDQKIYNDKLDRLQEREWKYRDRYGDKLEKADQTTKDEYRRIQTDKERAQKQLDVLDKKMLEQAK